MATPRSSLESIRHPVGCSCPVRERPSSSGYRPPKNYGRNPPDGRVRMVTGRNDAPRRGAGELRGHSLGTLLVVLVGATAANASTIVTTLRPSADTYLGR